MSAMSELATAQAQRLTSFPVEPDAPEREKSLVTVSGETETPDRRPRPARDHGPRSRAPSARRRPAQATTIFAPRSDPAAAGRALTLAAQIRRACARADALIAQSRRLRHLRAIARDRELMLCRCAWCERFHLDQRWLSLAEFRIPPAFADRVTHGICPDCVAELRRTGKSK